MVWYGMVWYGMVWYGSIRRRAARAALVKNGIFGMEWYGMLFLEAYQAMQPITMVKIPFLKILTRAARCRRSLPGAAPSDFIKNGIFLYSMVSV